GCCAVVRSAGRGGGSNFPCRPSRSRFDHLQSSRVELANCAGAGECIAQRREDFRRNARSCLCEFRAAFAHDRTAGHAFLAGAALAAERPSALISPRRSAEDQIARVAALAPRLRLIARSGKTAPRPAPVVRALRGPLEEL